MQRRRYADAYADDDDVVDVGGVGLQDSSFVGLIGFLGLLCRRVYKAYKARVFKVHVQSFE